MAGSSTEGKADRPKRGFRDRLFPGRKKGSSSKTDAGNNNESATSLASQASSKERIPAPKSIAKPVEAPARDAGFQDLCPISELWNQAYEDLKADANGAGKLITKYETIIENDLSTQLASAAGILSQASLKSLRKENMTRILTKKVAEVNDKKWKLRFNDHEVAVEDLVKPVVDAVGWADKYVSGALAANPYASIAWAGVSLILPIFLNPSKQAASMAEGLKKVSDLIVQSTIREALYAHRYESDTGRKGDMSLKETHVKYREELQKLYCAILKFQAGCVCYYYRGSSSRLVSDLAKWDDWDAELKEIQDQNKSFSEVYELMKSVMSQEDFGAVYRQYEKNTELLKSMGNDMSYLRKAIEKANEGEEGAKRAELLKWLSDVNPSTNYNSLIEKRGISAANWVFEDENVQKWETNADSLLWLNGKVGSGKSVLSAMAIRWITELHGSNPNVAIAYWYFSFSDQKKQSVHEMLRSLTKQLLCCRPDTPKAVTDLRSYQDRGHTPDLARLVSALLATIGGFPKVYIVIDALDECPISDHQRGDLLDSLISILKDCSSCVHMLCTSRPELDIAAAFKDLKYPSTRVDFDLASRQKAVNWGIRIYIDDTLARHPCQTWPENIKREVRDGLIEKADGMFQYISIQLETFRRLKGLKQIRKAIRDLPEGLDRTYERMFLAIEPSYHKQVVSMLKWLCFSFEPLSLAQLAEIFILDPESDVPFDKSDWILPVDEVLACLPGIVMTLGEDEGLMEESGTEDARSIEDEISIRYNQSIDNERSEDEPPNQRKNSVEDERSIVGNGFADKGEQCTEDDGYVEDHGSIEGRQSIQSDEHHPSAHLEVKLTHFSIQEYLLSKRILNGPAKAFHVVEEDAHVHIADSCLAYHLHLSKDIRIMDRRETINEFALLDYAVSYWYGHLERVPEGSFPDSVQHSLEQLFITSSLPFLNLLWLSGRLDTTPLRYAIFIDSLWLVKHFINKGVDLDELSGHVDNCANALQQVTARYMDESLEIMMLLLESGANVNFSGGYYGNVLQAATRGTESRVRILLDRGADVHAQGGRYGSVLQAAAYHGKENVVRLLLDHGANVHAQGGRYGSPLQAAASVGDKETVRILLDHGANIHAQGGFYGNALQAAASAGNKETVRILLDHGANIHAQGGFYGNALQAAASGEHEIIFKMLIDEDADVNAKGGHYGCALYAAIHSDAILKLLIAHDAVDLSDQEWLETQERLQNEVFGRLVISKIQLFRGDREGFMARLADKSIAINEESERARQ
ncbi:uncharacterized protein PAC_10663 [Phialocephala subalpina]|uniref:Uncharacterized protein n=1 Tax=Phialocephala subalpina TaxID=576137 RepID=A0A1L7X6W0_9HELO|nr:uncharacterized protein PAC_10663 [Phialocephala subalpina]